MLIVFTPVQDIAQEHLFIQALFANGLSVLHLRKPHKTYEEHQAYLRKIPERYHPKIVTHHHHRLTNDFALKGVHFTQKHREQYTASYNPDAVSLEKLCSSSFHALAAINHCSLPLRYCFLSPVFDSISKKGYKAKHFKLQNTLVKTIALGGVNASNIAKAKQLGYAGVAVLGAIWQASDPVKAFQEIQKAYRLEGFIA